MREEIMRRFVRSFALLFVLAISLLGTALVGAAPRGPVAIQAGQRIIPNRYIVTLRDGVDANACVSRAGVKAQYLYDRVLNGFAGELTANQLAALQRHADVLAIEADQVMTADVTQSLPTGEPWGIDRIDQRALPLSRTYTYNNNGAGVTVYVIDTGIQTSHSQFGGRAAVTLDVIGDGRNGQDCNGHGTHVAGTIGGSTYGVAKGVNLRAVRVLNCSGSGSTSGIISALNSLAGNHAARSVANMSLGGGFSSALNNASTNMINSGVYLAVAAGNSNANACNTSPASTPAAYTVAASDRTDRKASFSNFGSCVDGYAPGVAILSAWLNNGTNTISGTSMASPHVAGVAALFKGANGEASAATITNWINSNATAGVIIGNPSGTPNRLLFKSTL
jgi:subtilisin family serine protease